MPHGLYQMKLVFKKITVFGLLCGLSVRFKSRNLSALYFDITVLSDGWHCPERGESVYGLGILGDP